MDWQRGFAEASQKVDKKPSTSTTQEISDNYAEQGKGGPYGVSRFDTKPPFSDKLRLQSTRAIRELEANGTAIDESIVNELMDLATQIPSSIQAENLLGMMGLKVEHQE